MPSERRKEQNRLNQRRYRMQIRNRIQMLEKVIIDARGSVGNLGTESPNTDQPRSSNDAEDEISTGSLNSHAQPDLEALWNSEQTPFVFGNESDFMYQNTSAPWSTPAMSSFSGYETNSDKSNQMYDPSPLSNPAMDFGFRYYCSPKSENSSISFNLGQNQTLPVGPNMPHLGDSLDDSLFPNLGSTSMKPARGRPRRRNQNIETPEQTNNCPIEKTYRNDKEKTIAYLRAENRRLKELSAALANMYDVTKVPSSQNGQRALDMITSQVPPPSINYGELTTYNSPFSCPLNAEGFQFEALSSPVAFDPSQCIAPYDGCMEVNASTSWLMKNQSFADGTAFMLVDEEASQQFTLMELPIPPYQTQPSSLNTIPLTPPQNLKPSTPGNPIHLHYQNTNHTLTTTLPAPTTYDHYEPTFTRRLLRRAFQIGYHILLHPTLFPPSLLSRIYDFCLRFYSLEEVREKMRVCLGLGIGGELVVDELRWGRVHDRRDVDDENCVWIPGRDVEGWVRGRGFEVGGCEGNGEGRWGDDGGWLVRIVAAQSGVEVVEREKERAPVVPYGTVWDPSQPGALSAEEVLRACFNTPIENQVDGEWGCINAEQGRKNYLNIDSFFEMLMRRSICLGRTAGFLISDLEEVFELCLVER